MPGPLTFSNLCWWCFSFQQLAQILYLHQWWLPSATCAGGLYPSSTCAYIACRYCNLHCGGGGGGGIYDRFSPLFLSETPPDPPGLWSFPWEVPEGFYLQNYAAVEKSVECQVPAIFMYRMRHIFHLWFLFLACVSAN